MPPIYVITQHILGGYTHVNIYDGAKHVIAMGALLSKFTMKLKNNIINITFNMYQN